MRVLYWDKRGMCESVILGGEDVVGRGGLHIRTGMWEHSETGLTFTDMGEKGIWFPILCYSTCAGASKVSPNDCMCHSEFVNFNT